jgi:hypothetical protein
MHPDARHGPAKPPGHETINGSDETVFPVARKNPEINSS